MIVRRILAVTSLGLIGTVAAEIADDLAAATVIEEFTFDDAAGTAFHAAANSAGTGHLFDTDVDTNTVTTDGLGRLNASLKNNDEFGSNYINNDPVPASAGRIFGVMELTWNFQSALDVSENEEIRLGLMGFDPRSTFVAAEWRIRREDDNTLTLLGDGVGTGATDVGPVVLNGGSLVQSALAVVVIDLNATTGEYFVHFSNDGGSSFSSHGPGLFDIDRVPIESLRVTLDNNLSGDNVLIDRIYLATLSAAAQPMIHIGPAPDPGFLRVDFTGILQESTDLSGFADLDPQPDSPYLFATDSGPRFFRARQAP